MVFHTEPTGYRKTILSDLQGAWEVFRHTVADNAGFQGWDKVLFHTDEAMSWETVRDLKLMPPLVVNIRNLCQQGNAPEKVMAALADVHELLEETLEEFPQ